MGPELASRMQYPRRPKDSPQPWSTAMFDKRKEQETSPAPTSSTEPPQPSVNPTRAAAVIGQTIKVQGTISGEENLIIEGHVDGAIELPKHDLTIGTNGQVTANLTASMVRVDGQVTGDISGSEKVTISKSGKVQGNIVAPRVTLEDGAKFKGSIDMDPANEPAAAKPKAVAAKPEPVESADNAKTGS